MKQLELLNSGQINPNVFFLQTTFITVLTFRIINLQNVLNVILTINIFESHGSFPQTVSVQEYKSEREKNL